METFKCDACGKFAKNGVNGVKLSLCLIQQRLGSRDEGYTKLATRRYCTTCANKVARLIVDVMFGAIPPSMAKGEDDDRNE